MKTLLQVLSLAALLTLTACGAGADPAVGTWKLDTSSTLEAAKAMMEKQLAGQDEAMKKMASEMMEKAVGAMTGSLELKADGTASGSMSMPNPLGGEPQKSDASGTWKNDNGKVSIAMAEAGKDADTMTGQLEGDTLKMTEQKNGQEMTIVFTRQK